MGKTLLFLLLASLGPACGTDAEPHVTEPVSVPEDIDEVAEMIITGATRFSGVDKLSDDARASFRFRDRTYTYERVANAYTYTREFTDSAGAAVVDVLTDSGISRTVAGVKNSLSAKQARGYTESVNSVIYFAFLPLALKDDAVRSAYEGPDSLAGRSYHRVRVSFVQEGGGSDFEDEFLYWFDAEDLSLDFLAYAYETDGGGVRFREAINAREVNGVRVQDYRNYRAEPERSLPLEAMADAWRAGELVLLSLIELEDVRIDPDVD